VTYYFNHRILPAFTETINHRYDDYIENIDLVFPDVWASLDADKDNKVSLQEFLDKFTAIAVDEEYKRRLHHIDVMRAHFRRSIPDVLQNIAQQKAQKEAREEAKGSAPQVDTGKGKEGSGEGVPSSSPRTPRSQRRSAQAALQQATERAAKDVEREKNAEKRRRRKQGRAAPDDELPSSEASDGDNGGTPSLCGFEGGCMLQ